MDSWNTSSLVGWPIFRANSSFQGGIYYTGTSVIMCMPCSSVITRGIPQDCTTGLENDMSVSSDDEEAAR